MLLPLAVLLVLLILLLFCLLLTFRTFLFRVSFLYFISSFSFSLRNTSVRADDCTLLFSLLLRHRGHFSSQSSSLVDNFVSL